jgi:hypothetical protein
MEDKILEAYKKWRLGNTPFSWQKLAESAGVSEAEILRQFPTQDLLDVGVWRDLLFRTLAKVKTEPVYADYTSREKMLSFHYTIVESLKSERELVLWYLKPLGVLDVDPQFLKDFFIHFQAFATEVLNEGMETGQIPKRYWISSQYARIHHLQALYVLRTWAEDASENQVHTDSAIEKAVNLGFDLMERNFVDSAWDFGKFLFTRN